MHDAAGPEELKSKTRRFSSKAAHMMQYGDVDHIEGATNAAEFKNVALKVFDVLR